MLPEALTKRASVEDPGDAEISMDSLFGLEMPTAGKVVIALAVVVGLLAGITWAIRRYGADHFGNAASRGRQPRLAVVDAAAVDGRRRLVIVRRDNVEHLLMIGGPTDVVVESNIVRAVSSARDLPRDMPVPTRVPPMPDAPPRPLPLNEGSLWPLQPQPEVVVRPQRAAPDPVIGLGEELASRTPSPQRPAMPPPEPSRPEASQTETNRPEASRPTPPTLQPAPVQPPPPQFVPPQFAPPPTAPTTQAAHSADQNLAEMANRLEAALRGSSEPRRQEPMKPETNEPAAAKAEAKPARSEVKPGPSKSLYDSLEQEMASLLGRPPGKT
jgi:hypothetical protein